MSILKNYANLTLGPNSELRQTHYRRAGSGSPLIMLHASPMSSELMMPLMQHLHDVVDVIAPDTPGYGDSDPLPVEMLEANSDLTPYVEWLLAFIDSHGLAKVGVYGTATGAQIAIEFAHSYPERVEYIVLDNAAHFTDDQRNKIMDGYFPDVTPKADGSHLQQVWNMARGVFTWFPWYLQDEAHRVSDVTPPTAAVHITAMAYLEAGTDYAQAYRRAFQNERAERVQEIIVPVRIIRWAGSVLKEYSDRFDDYVWPTHIQMVQCAGDISERNAAIKKTIQGFVGL